MSCSPSLKDKCDPLGSSLINFFFGVIRFFLSIIFYDINDVIIRALIYLRVLFFFTLSSLQFILWFFYWISSEWYKVIKVIFFKHVMYKLCFFTNYFFNRDILSLFLINCANLKTKSTKTHNTSRVLICNNN
jgi:hypothetical protein